MTKLVGKNNLEIPKILTKVEQSTRFNMAEEVKLLGSWTSPYNFRVKLALNVKGIEFSYAEEDLKSKSSLLLASNPIQKKIPVLIHNGRPVCESLIILEYIDEVWQCCHSLLPNDHFERAKTRFWSSFLDEKITRMGYNSLKMTETQWEEHCSEFSEQLEYLQNELRGKEFFGGESIGYLDVVALSVMYWLQIGEEVTGKVIISNQRFSNITKWIAKLCELDVVKNSLPDRKALASHIRIRVEELRLVA